MKVDHVTRTYNPGLLRMQQWAWTEHGGYCLDAPEWIARGGHYLDGDETGAIASGYNHRDARDWYANAAPGYRTQEERDMTAQRGRKPLHGEPMTPAERQAKKRNTRLFRLAAARTDLDEIRRRLRLVARDSENERQRNALTHIEAMATDLWDQLGDIK